MFPHRRTFSLQPNSAILCLRYRHNCCSRYYSLWLILTNGCRRMILMVTDPTQTLSLRNANFFLHLFPMLDSILCTHVLFHFFTESLRPCLTLPSTSGWSCLRFDYIVRGVERRQSLADAQLILVMAIRSHSLNVYFYYGTWAA